VLKVHDIYTGLYLLLPRVCPH